MPTFVFRAALAALLLTAGFAATDLRADEDAPRLMVDALNAERAARGLGRLATNRRLANEAQFLAERLAEENTLRIDLAAQQQRLRSAGYPYRRIASVAASGTGQTNLALEHVMARSNASEDVLSSEYSEIGIGRAGDEVSYWVVTLAHPIREADAGWRRELLMHVNAYRARYGLAALTLNETLNVMAQAHSDDMARRDYFGHDTPEGITVADRAVTAGYKYGVISENLAAGLRKPEEVVQGWIRSEPHRVAMMNEKITEAGAGYSFVPFDDGQVGSVHYWTLNMGRPRTKRR